MTDFNEWASKMNAQFKENIQAGNTADVNNGREMIARKEVEFDCGYFTFKTRNKFLPRHYRMVSQFKGKENDASYDDIQDGVARIMADVDLDPAHDIQFWKSFDEETGELVGVFSVVCEELQNNIKSAQVFRKQ